MKVEAAIALQMMLSSQDELAKQYVEPKIREITLELLNIIRQTENDDLTSVMQKIVCTYTEQVKSCDVFKRFYTSNFFVYRLTHQLLGC